MGTEPDGSFLLRPNSRRILDMLLSGRKSLTELATSTGVAKSSLVPTLKRLVDAGWVQRDEVRLPTGREVFYALRGGSIHLELRPESGVALSWASEGRLDDTFPFTAQIPDPAVREEVLAALRLLRKPMRKKLDQGFFSIILFGSAARDEVTWKSDIDLLFLFQHEDPGMITEWIRDEVAKIQEFTTHPVRAHTMEREVFLEGARTIAREAASEGIVLWAARGDPVWPKMRRYRSISI